MDFEDIFVNKNRHHSNYKMRKHYDNDTNYPYTAKQEKFNPFELLGSIRRSKKLKIIILAILAVVAVIIIGLILLLLPLITKIVNYIIQNGVSGVFELIVDYLNTFWHGAE